MTEAGCCSCGSPLCKWCSPMPWMTLDATASKGLVGKIDFEKSHDVPPLPKEWSGIYNSYKNECYRYEKALRLILTACESAGVDGGKPQKVLNHVEDLVRLALEGSDGP